MRWTHRRLYEGVSERKKKLRLHLLKSTGARTAAGHQAPKRAAELAWHSAGKRGSASALACQRWRADQPRALCIAEALQHWPFHAGLELARTIEDRAREAEVLEKVGAVLRLGGTIPHCGRRRFCIKP